MDNEFEYVSSELLAAYLDGELTAEECQDIFRAVEENSEMQEILEIAQAVDEDLGIASKEIECLPMTALAASCGDANYCSLQCEQYILKKRGISFDEDSLKQDAIANGWQKQDGTALFNIGRHLEGVGLVVSRRYQCTIQDIIESLRTGSDLIAAVDGGELLANCNHEHLEEIFARDIPDHSIVILACDEAAQTIQVYDPNSPHETDTYSWEQFAEAWADSKNYLVIIGSDMKNYTPHPIDLSDVVLHDDLHELQEAIAENAHEIWAQNRQSQGWMYGPQRNDELKQTPDMVPYSQLPDSEKLYDREMAMQTIKLLHKLGYDLIKRENTAIYMSLRDRLRNAQQEIQCPCCGHAVSKYQIFCDECGQKLE